MLMERNGTATKSTPPDPTQWLADLKARRREPGEASFFWYDTQFQRVSVKVLPGEYSAHAAELVIATTLGSCIACCLWDRGAQVGGMNHFMLPEGNGSDGGRFGTFAMEKLINALLKLGARRGSLEAKVFGGGQVLSGMTTMNIGERNARFAMDFLRTERIPVVSSDVLDIYPRKVAFLPVSGKAMVKRLPASQSQLVASQERVALDRKTDSGSGSVELF
jgi:chemotaxis protein CheD